MALNITDLFTRMRDHALSTGLFETVNGHEPKSAPGHGLTAAMWTQVIQPVRSSGLDSTTLRVEVSVRIYKPMLSEPQDAIDPDIVSAVDVLCDAYSGDFTLGGTIREVDLLGAYGAPLSAVAGYLNQDSKLYRVMTVTVPLIVNDVWGQAE